MPQGTIRTVSFTLHTALNFTVIVDEPAMTTVTYGDVNAQVGNLKAVGNNITQAFEGLLWDVSDKAKIVGSYSLGRSSGE